MTTTTTTDYPWRFHDGRPQYPQACRSLYCGEYDMQGAACLGCSDRPTLDAYYRAHAAWADALPEDDGRPSTAEIQAIGHPARATRALGVDGQRY